MTRQPSPVGDVEIPTRVLVLGMAHEDGTIHVGEITPVAEACGQTPDQVRSCIRRLVTEGLFVRRGRGRGAVLEATEAGRESLARFPERARLAYAQDAAGRGWDRNWRLVAFAVPERLRSSRDALRDRLRELGGAPVHNGLYVSPHRWEPDVLAAAERLDLLGNVTTATTDDLTVGGVSDPRAIASRLWPLDEIAAAYSDFVSLYEGIPEELERMRREGRRLRESEFLPGALVIGMKFRECFDADPLLPPELLPRPWPGRRARELLLRSRRLGVLVREEHDRPRLFAPFDDLMGSVG